MLLCGHLEAAYDIIRAYENHSVPWGMGFLGVGVLGHLLPYRRPDGVPFNIGKFRSWLEANEFEPTVES